MSESAGHVGAEAPTRIGPVAHHRLFENDDVLIWQVDTPAGEAFWRHYHHYDYVLFHTTEMLGASYEAPEDFERIWRARLSAGETLDEALGGWCYEHSVNFIPGTGWLSPGYVNIGDTRFTAALVELKRPRRSDQQAVGFSRSDSLVGLPARHGSVMLLENDRVRVWETALAPGEGDEGRAQQDSAVYVIDGGRIRIEEEAPGREDARVAEHPSVSGHWRSGGRRRRLVNVGDAPYRELAVELK